MCADRGPADLSRHYSFEDAVTPPRSSRLSVCAELQLVGREELLDQVLGELAARRAVVMSGAAGVGR